MWIDNMEQVIDMLAEKVGVAAEKLMPVAEELLVQVSARGLVLAIACAAACVVACCLTVMLWRRCFRHAARHADDGGGVGYGFAAMVMTAITVVAFVHMCMGMIEYVAPLPSILGFLVMICRAKLKPSSVSRWTTITAWVR